MAAEGEYQVGLFENMGPECCANCCCFPCIGVYKLNEKTGNPCPGIGAYCCAGCLPECTVCFYANTLKGGQESKGACLLKALYCAPCYMNQMIQEPMAQNSALGSPMQQEMQ